MEAARAGQLQVGLAAGPEAAPGDGRPGPGAALRPGGGRREQPALSRQGRAGRAPARAAVALGAFVAAAIASGSTVVSDGWSGYARLRDVKHDPRVIGETPAHLVLPWVHRVFANAKRWALGVYHGLRPAHLQAYLDEFVFRFDRRRTPHAAFERLLDLSLTLEPATYQMLVGRS